MSVTITITDPSSTPPEELQAVVTLLSTLGNHAAVIHVASNDQQLRTYVEELKAHETLFPATDDQPSAFVRGVAEAAAEQIAATVFGAPASPAADQPSTVAAEAAPVIPQPPVAAAEAFGASSIPATVGVELDKDGIPWDGRIHASTKTKTVEGVWKKKRGVEQSVVDSVTAELRAVMAAPIAGVPAAVVPPPPPPAPVPAVEVHAASAIPSHELGGAVPLPPPPPSPATTGITFAEFMGHVTAGVTSARFTRENVSEACVKHGIPNLPGLINRPDLIPAVARELGLVA